MEMNLGVKQEGGKVEQDSKVKDYVESFSDPESQNSQIFEQLKDLDHNNTEEKSENLEKMGLMARKVHEITQRAKNLSANQQKAFKLKTQRAMLAIGTITGIVAPIAAQMADKIDFSNPNGGMIVGIGALAGVSLSSLFTAERSVALNDTKVNVERAKIELHDKVLNKDEYLEESTGDSIEKSNLQTQEPVSEIEN